MFPTLNPFAPTQATNPLLVLAAGLAAGLVEVNADGKLAATEKGERILDSLAPPRTMPPYVPDLQA